LSFRPPRGVAKAEGLSYFVSSPAAVVTAAKPAASKPVKVITGGQLALASFAGFLMRAWASSLRIVTLRMDRDLFAEAEKPTLFILWHNRLFIAAEISRRYRPSRPLHALVSASKDGAWLSAFFEKVGLRVVRGSSHRGGREAVSSLVQVLRAGNDAGITPDGPRGPCYKFKPGALVVARRAQVRVAMIGLVFSRSWRLPSWDKFHLPQPFSSVWLETTLIDAETLAAEDAAERIERALLEMNPDPEPFEPGVVV
jgi:lysophospholipid acyltransferase (LPLAT)-like uncharacterized protein